MIGISVAVGRFVETLIWAILRVAGVVAGYAVIALIVLTVAAVLARRWWRKRPRKQP